MLRPQIRLGDICVPPEFPKLDEFLLLLDGSKM